MNFDFLKLNQSNSMPYIRTKFFATFFATLITASINIARDSNGVIYMLSKKLYFSLMGNIHSTSIVWLSLKNFGSIVVQCADVAFSVIIIFFFIDFTINRISNKIYSKVFKSRRKYLKELLWENIVPNILEISTKEKEFLKQINSFCTIDIEQLAIILSTISDIHLDLLTIIFREGVFEKVEGNQKLHKYYIKYMESIKFPLLYVIFKEEEKIIQQICTILENTARKNDFYEIIFKQYNVILKKYHSVVNLINENSQHEQLKFLFD